ncbi:chitin binding peritrophin-A-like protein [Chitinophaga dinghuensis]|uniref:Chitin binding peritrophin-A-like protein n=1 Tax=Chitinophaga dinghuensis TaxID=1539050 RepID=A0A327VTJ7_9BACT|nr:carbohydrate-binding module family 14 protein [Chitinophaga dinghuensis]RAJ77349.1 chitin binding peritrophin-A-like protein [Chitinophaga dinghuensis]
MKKIIMAVIAAIGLFSVVRAQSVLIPDPTDCSKFYQCSNGTLISRNCPPGLVFDKDRDLCDLPANVGCETDPTASAPTECTMLGDDSPTVCGTTTIEANTEVYFDLGVDVDLTKYVKIAEVVVNGKTMVKYRSKVTTTKNMYIETCPGYAGSCTKHKCE